MPIKFTCPACAKKLVVKDALAGKKGACPGCKKIMVVPMQSTYQAPDLEAAAAAALAPEVAQKSAEPEPEFTFIEMTCPMCDFQMKVLSTLAGKQTPCPECRRIVKVPAIKKEEPKNWLKPPQIPSGAAMSQQVPELEGQWGSRTTSGNVSSDALEEADVLPTEEDEADRIGALGWMLRGFVALIGLWLLVTLLAWGMSWSSSRFEDRLLSYTREPLDPKVISKTPPELQAELETMLAEFYLKHDRADTNKRNGTSHAELALFAVGHVQDPVERITLLRTIRQLHVDYPNQVKISVLSNVVASLPGESFREPALREYIRWHLSTKGTKQAEPLRDLLQSALPARDVVVKRETKATLDSNLNVPLGAARTTDHYRDVTIPMTALAVLGQEIHGSNAKLAEEIYQKLIKPAKSERDAILTLADGKLPRSIRVLEAMLDANLVVEPAIRAEATIRLGKREEGRALLDREFGLLGMDRSHLQAALADSHREAGDAAVNDWLDLGKSATAMASHPTFRGVEEQLGCWLWLAAEKLQDVGKLNEAMELVVSPLSPRAQLCLKSRKFERELQPNKEHDPRRLEDLDGQGLGRFRAIASSARHYAQLNQSSILNWIDRDLKDKPEERAAASAGLMLTLPKLPK